MTRGFSGLNWGVVWGAMGNEDGGPGLTLSAIDAGEVFEG